MPLLLARSGDLRAAICIDQVLGSREIVVKPVGPQVNSVPGIFGATIMGDGRVVVILDVAPLVRRQAAIVRDATPVAPRAGRRSRTSCRWSWWSTTRSPCARSPAACWSATTSKC